ncbi:MAG: Extracellular solute-binding protein family 1 [Candidatus Uhrbacteria bacterium GW2011_GWF2_41_16]|uniref:Extracellular solute-binding protein family 1 n=1 Tax=Candidatus Uhrbacteria bacterium GW2011_GWF2_41_16 TaxID=1618997 RepID=A0A0G0V8U3_9BACT|nr:MAG: Extracellular solute-binding protein family 1 [Candidatus Uhrbacteria bacterium GW2011_GWF2_41_16]OHB36118.1 MAG: iron ABC transporter substrate-binding protein [Planctomycetes bacterium GWA2_39_15]OHB86395.1 MAG: iron ABC transporter substrate-binding protein [Planctomycetes bacterium RIFCSPHIGHO2_02_FULL_40_12]
MKSRIIFHIALVGIISLAFIAGCSQKDTNEVVVYVSEDQVFSEPVLRDFENDTGIKVKVVYDTEETKSTGVMNRLIGEMHNPQADVYWANEPIRAIVLKQKGISEQYFSPNAEGIPADFKDPQGYWTGFSARARILIVSTEEDPPSSISAYTDEKWKDKGVVANPLFGTTTSWVATLFTVWGDNKARDFMEGMKENGTKVSTSNGESTMLVANNEFLFSVVDSDDATNAMRNGKPVWQIYPDQEEGELGCLVLPNATVLIKGCPNPENGRKLIDYLLSPQTERKLAFADCAQIPLHKGVETPNDVVTIEKLKLMKVDFEVVAEKLQEIQPYLKEWVGY